MIMTSIDNLIDYLKNNCSASVEFANHDPSPEQYPLINVMPSGDSIYVSRTTTITDLTLGLTLTIIVAKENVHEGLRVLYEVLTVVNNYNAYAGSMLSPEGTISQIFTDNTYEVTLPYQLQVPCYRS